MKMIIGDQQINLNNMNKNVKTKIETIKLDSISKVLDFCTIAIGDKKEGAYHHAKSIIPAITPLISFISSKTNNIEVRTLNGKMTKMLFFEFNGSTCQVQYNHKIEKIEIFKDFINNNNKKSIGLVDATSTSNHLENIFSKI